MLRLVLVRRKLRISEVINVQEILENFLVHLLENNFGKFICYPPKFPLKIGEKCNFQKLSALVHLLPQIKEQWAVLDSNNTGSVCFKEFLVWYYRYYGPPTASEIEQSKKILN